MGYNVRVRAAAGVVALLLALACLAEVVTRVLLDDAVTTTATAGLAWSSQDGQGFTEVTGDARGWAVPDLVRGGLSGVDVVATDGELGGLPIQRLTATTGRVDLGDRHARDVAIVATTDPANLVPRAGDLLGVDLTGGTITAGGPDLLLFSGDVAGVALTADVRLAPDGTGGLVATAAAVTADGEPVDPALLPSAGAPLLRAEDLPAGFVVESATVRDGPAGALVDVALRCAGDCDLAAVATGSAASVRR